MSTTPPFDPNTNPKAAAKAAKAYAKATRPWFKKKRFIIPIALVVVGIISTATGGGGTSEPTDDETPVAASAEKSGDKTEKKAAAKKPEKKKAKKVGTKSNPAPKGKAVKNKSASYRVDKIEIVDGGLGGGIIDAPAGKYVIVTLTVKNVKDETIQISSGDFKLAADGKQFDADDDGIFLDEGFSYDDLSPSLERTGQILFDVPDELAGKGTLIAQAMLSMDSPIYLSLK